ncbi:hypothetical protein ACP275_02G153900 [Erythranthe tilingii]
MIILMCPLYFTSLSYGLLFPQCVDVFFFRDIIPRNELEKTSEARFFIHHRISLVHKFRSGPHFCIHRMALNIGDRNPILLRVQNRSMNNSSISAIAQYLHVISLLNHQSSFYHRYRLPIPHSKFNPASKSVRLPIVQSQADRKRGKLFIISPLI